MTGWLVPLDIPVDIDRAAAQRRALDELARAKYGGVPDVVEDALRRSLEFLEDISSYLSGLGRVSGGGVGPGFGIAVLVLLVAAALVVWRVGLPRWVKRRVASDDLALDATRAATDYRAEAEAAAAAGQWQHAVRDRFRALVRELEVRTVLDVRPARTAWEAASAADRVLPDSGPDLFAGADLFSGVSYGDRPAAQHDYEAMVGIDQRVTAAADTADLAGDSAEDNAEDNAGTGSDRIR